MKLRRRHVLLSAPPAILALAACSSGGATAAPTSAPTRAASGTVSGAATGATATATPTPELVYVFSNSAPHITVVNAASNQIVQTKDVPDFKTWGTSDDNNYYDGKNVWLGHRNPDTDDVEVLLIDLDTLSVAQRIPLGKDKTTVYIGKGSRRNQVWCSKHASGQVAIVDSKTYQVLEIKDVPVNGGVACDMDVMMAPDGVERAYIPTDTGDTTIAINLATREVVQTYNHTKGIRPYMLTASPDGKYVWVQERGSDGQIVLDSVTLQPVKQVPTGKGAYVNTFTPDGKVSLVGHNADTRIVAVDAATFQTIKDVEVGTNAQVVAVTPSGRAAYAIATRENLVAAINTANWQITQKVQLSNNPAFVFTRRPDLVR
jgi:DNA-binding beta-propeller fold protein YncE